MTSLKQIPLYDLHVKSGAKLISFAGYQMPVHYAKGIIHEHLHCRSHAGLFDISHMGQCLVKGEGAAGELEKLCTGNITRLKNGQQQYSVFTNSDGGIIDDIMITRFEGHLAITVNAACKDKDFLHLQKHLFDHVQLQVLNEHSLLALQGPEAANIMLNLAPEACKLSFMTACHTEIEGIRCMISRSGYTGEDGFEISVSNKQANELALLILNESGVELIGLGARDTLRMEAGLSLYGHELSESITPVEAGLNWVIHGNNRRFPGAGTILYQLQNGSDIQRVGLIVDARTPVREHAVIFDEEGNSLGHVTSGGFSPTLGKPIAMALINTEAAIIGTKVYAQVRNIQVTLTVCDLPFVPRRYYRG